MPNPKPPKPIGTEVPEYFTRPSYGKPKREQELKNEVSDKQISDFEKLLNQLLILRHDKQENRELIKNIINSHPFLKDKDPQKIKNFFNNRTNLMMLDLLFHVELAKKSGYFLKQDLIPKLLNLSLKNDAKSRAEFLKTLKEVIMELRKDPELKKGIDAYLHVLFKLLKIEEDSKKEFKEPLPDPIEAARAAFNAAIHGHDPKGLILNPIIQEGVTNAPAVPEPAMVGEIDSLLEYVSIHSAGQKTSYEPGKSQSELDAEEEKSEQDPDDKPSEISKHRKPSWVSTKYTPPGGDQ